MRIGTLVRWVGDSEDYGCLGIVSKDDGESLWITWADGDIVNYNHSNIQGEHLEVICK